MDTLKFQLRWYSAPSLTSLIAGTCCVVLLFVDRVHGRVWLGVLGVAFFVSWAALMYLSTVEVTPADVRACVRSFRRTVVPREGIRAMHWNSSYFTLLDSGHGVLLRIGCYGWTRSQLLELSEALGVSLYNHRTKRGFGKDVRVGKLVTRPPAKTK